MTNNDLMRSQIYKDLGVVPSATNASIEELARTEWSPGFERLLRNRLIMGGFRYGLLNDPDKPQYDRISRARSDIHDYEVTGNKECLVDTAAMMLLEFEEGVHPLSHFAAREDVGHVEASR
jgi:hypothetical protein